MKKRVVAVLLSLSMCMATAAEATVASAADFSAEITAAEDNDESVADETADSQDVEDSTVTIEDGEVSDEEHAGDHQRGFRLAQYVLLPVCGHASHGGF